ncbi:endodeoxyribonuclease RusA [Novosphingobium lentum]|uniref:endodeoxyribonuclease RusA n=1 Tax=Novosphingobium lentum TaxID=145287 RepID=UPI00082DA56D|nr:endodeoxyribonuclease RusA [Novosphingobium lentum]
MASDAGASARYQSRRERRIHINIDDIEPQSKKMSAADRAAFQAAVAEQLTSIKRSTFRGDVALQLDLATASKSPPHAHTIAKNILDLLGQRMDGVDWPKKSLLYADDSQIQALSVLCRHGEDRPNIRIEARPFTAMLDDLELAAKALQAAETMQSYYEREREGEWIDTFRDLVRDEKGQRKALGDKMYEAYREMVRWSAQRALLGRSGVDIAVLGWMYGLPRGLPTGLDKTMWSSLVGDSKLRLQVGELPIVAGGSSAFRQTVAAEIAAFKKRWDWIISPLVVAVALEVVVRPNPKTPPAVLHDLDNIVRDYLIPGIVPAFGTVSDHRWTIDFAELRARDPKLADAWGPTPTPPAGTRNGVTRYEVWRLPAVEGEPGFVSVALVADIDAKGDLMRQMDDQISEWRDNLSNDGRPSWRRRRRR